MTIEVEENFLMLKNAFLNGDVDEEVYMTIPPS